jgi:hypothetical protein
MADEANLPLSHKRRSGSETRQKERRISLRVTGDEYARVETASTEAGLTLASYTRSLLIDAPRTRTRRRPRVDMAALAKLLGELNRIGGNIHQILRRVNFGETPIATEFHEALRGHREIISAIRVAMGMEA